MSVQNCLSTLRKITEKSRSRIHRSGRLKSGEVNFFIGTIEVTSLARGKGKGKVPPCTGTESLYRQYDP